MGPALLYNGEDLPPFSGDPSLPCSTVTISNCLYLSAHSDLGSQHILPPAGDFATCFTGQLRPEMVLGGGAMALCLLVTPLPQLANSITFSKNFHLWGSVFSLEMAITIPDPRHENTCPDEVRGILSGLDATGGPRDCWLLCRSHRHSGRETVIIPVFRMRRPRLMERHSPWPKPSHLMTDGSLI